MTVEIRDAVSAADWRAVQSVRRRVFVEEQGVPEADEWDAADADALRGRTVRHLLAESDGQPVGAARWRPAPGPSTDAPAGTVPSPRTAVAKLERFAVVPEARGCGIARQLVARALADARTAGFERFVLHAQTYAVGLYAGFGFVTGGAPFDEDGLEHVKMTLVD